MQNGHAKTNGVNGTNGHAKHLPVPVEAATPAVPEHMQFVDELTDKIRESIKKAATAEAQKMTGKIGARRYLEGLRRAANLITMGLAGLDGAAKEKLFEALQRLEDEVAAAEKDLAAVKG